MKRLLLILSFVTCYGIMHAQWRGLRLSSIGPEEGLTMRVNAMVQDSTGFLYFGGAQGLTRYDGITLEPFINILDDSTTIRPGEVVEMLNSSDDKIWFSLRFSGLNYFDPKTNAFKHYALPRVKPKMEYGCYSILEDEKSDIWAGGQHFRLYRVNQEKDSLEVYFPEWIEQEKLDKRYAFVKIIQDNVDPDIFWLSVVDYRDPNTSKSNYYGYGLMTFNRQTKKFKSYPNIGKLMYQNEDGTLLSSYLVNRIPTFHPGNNEYRTITFKTSDYPNEYLSRDLIETGENKWLVTAYEILNIDKNGKSNTIFKSQTDDPMFTSFHRDRSNHIWLTTAQGARVFDPKANHIKFFSLEKFGSLLRIYPGRIAYDAVRNLIYLAYSKGINNKRLYRIPLDQENAQEADYLDTEHATWGITSDLNGKIWLSGGGHLYNLENDKLVSPEEMQFRDLHIPWHWNMRTSDQGMIGIIPQDRFIWFHPATGEVYQVFRDSFPESKIQHNAENRFLGFEFGKDMKAYVYSAYVYQIDLVTEEVTLLEYEPEFNPTGDEIYDVREDKEGFLWISSPMYTGKFEIVDNKLKLIRAYTVQDGLAESQVTEMHVDHQNRIWCFTGSGLNCIDEVKDEVRYFGVKEGLPQIFTDPRQVLTLPDNSITTVNKNGLIVFHPDSLWNAQSKQSVPVVIKEIRVNGQPVKNKTQPNFITDFTLPVEKSVVDIRFQGLFYPNANQLNYSYRLTNLQEDWIDIGTNQFVTLSGLSPGKYRFEVKAGAPGSNAPIKVLRLTVPTPFYQQWWFILISLGLLALCIYLIYQNRVNKIRKEESDKTKTNQRIAELELKALRSQMNPHFMFNSLNSIKNFILRSEKKEAAEYLSNFAHLIRLILQNSREKQISLKDELETLLLYIELEQLRFDDEFQFNCDIGENVMMDSTMIPPMILQPYVENAIWHGLMHKKEKGTLSLIFEKSNGQVKCIIEDNGVGRKKAMELKNKSIRKYKSMGMGITKDRIELMNRMNVLGISVEVIDLEPEVDGNTGTRVMLKIPSSTQSL